MVVYVPASKRRRRLLVAAAVALVVGLGGGYVIGRVSTPTVSDRVASAKSEARDISGGLRVLALHEQAGVSGSSGEDDLVFQRTRERLRAEFASAPWIGATTRATLLADLDQVASIKDRSSSSYGKAVEALADEIDTAFGVS